MNGVASAFLAIPEIVVLGLVATGVGRRLLGRGIPDSTDLERAALGFPVGMGLLSILMTGLLFGKVPAPALPFVVVGVGIAAACWARTDVADTVRGLRAFVRESPVLAAIIGASALVGAIGCLAPETGWDSGVYHFAMARLRAQQGGMLVRPDVPHGYRPASFQVLSTLGFVLNGETLASFVNEAFYFAGLALARLWGIRAGGPRAGTFASLAWLTSVTYVLRMDGGDVELGQAVYLGVTLLSLLRLRDGGSAGWRVLAGGSLGLFVGMKYSSIYAAVVVAAAWVVVRLLDRAPLRALIADGVVIGILGLLIACPCYLRNKIVMGQMFYPILTSKLAADAGRTSADAESAMAVLRSLGMDGFILVGVLALFLEGLKRDRWTGAVAVVFLLVMMVQMGWSGANYANAMRYASAAWIPLLGMAGAAVAWAVARGGAPRLLALGVLFGAAVLGQGVLILRNLPKLPVVLGLQNRDLYLADRVNTYGAIREAEAGLTPGKSVLLVEERVYYCRAPFLGASDIQGAVDFSVMKSAAEVRRFLEREAIGAIVVDRAPNAKIWRFRNLESRLGGSWPPPGVRLAETRGAASLYRVE